MDDYYAYLELPRDACEADIKKQYKILALKYHPDKQRNGDSTEKFQKIAKAYAVLTDPEKRAQYERYGSSLEPSSGQSLGEAVEKLAPLFLAIVVGGCGSSACSFGFLSLRLCFFLETLVTGYSGTYFLGTKRNFRKTKRSSCSSSDTSEDSDREKANEINKDKNKNQSEEKSFQVFHSKEVSDFITIATVGLFAGNFGGFLFASSIKWFGAAVGVTS